MLLETMGFLSKDSSELPIIYNLQTLQAAILNSIC